MQVNLEKMIRKYSAFAVPGGFYQFKRMSFGLKEDFESYLKLVERVLVRLLEAEIKVNREKCEFACSSVTYLVYLLDKDGLRPDPERVKVVLEIPKPKNVKELHKVLGMFGWYSRFIENEAEKKMPLVRLLRKESPWQ